MTTLIIDTSYSTSTSLGLDCEEKVYSLHLPLPDRSFSKFWKGIETIFTLSGVKKTEIGAVAVSIGPGPFTSLRNGITVAKTTSQILGIPIITFSLTEVINFTFPDPKPTIIFDGRAGKILIKRPTSTTINVVKAQNFEPEENEFIISIGCKNLLKETQAKILNFNHLPIDMIAHLIRHKINNSDYERPENVLPIYYDTL